MSVKYLGLTPPATYRQFAERDGNTLVTSIPYLKVCDVAFNNVETARYAGLIEKLIWAKRRPPLHLRDKVREGQRIEGREIELFHSAAPVF